MRIISPDKDKAIIETTSRIQEIGEETFDGSDTMMFDLKERCFWSSRKCQPRVKKCYFLVSVLKHWDMIPTQLGVHNHRFLDFSMNTIPPKRPKSYTFTVKNCICDTLQRFRKLYQSFCTNFVDGMSEHIPRTIAFLFQFEIESYAQYKTN